jgi:hypothetical protein
MRQYNFKSGKRKHFPRTLTLAFIQRLHILPQGPALIAKVVIDVQETGADDAFGALDAECETAQILQAGMVLIGNKVEFDRQGGVALEPEFPGRGDERALVAGFPLWIFRSVCPPIPEVCPPCGKARLKSGAKINVWAFSSNFCL